VALLAERHKTVNTLKKSPMSREREDRQSLAGLVAFYDIRSVNGAGLAFQPEAHTEPTDSDAA